MSLDDAAWAEIEAAVEDCLDAADPEAALRERTRSRPELLGPARRVLWRVAPQLCSGTGDAVDRPRRIGDYRILEGIGQGAMGTVFRAQQVAPIQREVALKLLVAGAMDAASARRFELERETLARMNHEAIAQVFDAGTTPDGRPYLVMELVDGQPIDAFGRDHELSLEERLRLFVAVCAGVQHAHFKGIIHRDLKPHNVLVTRIDGRSVPKIIDFGLARALGPQLLDDALRTVPGQMVGTPAYMSPEQAAASADVDTRADVYSLGAMLFELLVGSPPSVATDLEGLPLVEVRDRLLRREPELPSRRGGDRLRGDLDSIVVCAMANDPDSRYASVHDLAADVERHLAHEPVVASRGGVWLRTIKFVRRHSWQVTAIVVVLVALVAGLVVSTSFFLESEAQRKVADDRAREFDWIAGIVALEDAKDGLLTSDGSRVEGLQSWLEEQGEPVVARLAGLREAIATMRERGRHDVARSGRARLAQEQETAQLDEYLEYLEEELGRGRHKPEFLSAEQERSEHRRKVLQQMMNPESKIRFERRSEDFLFAAITQLEVDLEQFAVEWVDRVRRRRDDLRLEAEPRSPDEQSLWREVSDALPGGLVPQAGLVPLGRDPHSDLFEFYHPASGDDRAPVPVRDGTGRLELDAASGIVFVLIPGGSFWMGASRDPEKPNHDPYAGGFSYPPNEVKLDPYFIGKHEVSQAQWERLRAPFSPSRPSRYRPGSLLFEERDAVVTVAHPVERVSHDEAEAALRWAGLALPTEAQWECAARAGTSTPWWVGDDPEGLRSTSNLGGATEGEIEWRDTDGYSEHVPVYSMEPNPFGLHHVHGNVWEWCEDHFVMRYRDAVRDAEGRRWQDRRNLAHRQYRALRGGSFYYGPGMARSAKRLLVGQDYRDGSVGFRAARPVVSGQSGR